MDGQWTSDKLNEALLEHFGYASFREGQLETVQQVLKGDDVVLVMPTGSGKSLCYQLTALLMPGVTVVVSPLIALMKDQVDGMKAKGIDATYINSSVTAREMTQRLNGMRSGRFKLVYVAPERFRNSRFQEALAECSLSLLTIDEAHCISQWGHDFRPDYLNLKNVVEKFPAARVLAVTATATPEVRDDIIVQLGMDGSLRQAPAVLVTGFARPNLFLIVSQCSTHKHKLMRLKLVIAKYGCGIVYCSTRKMVERVAAMLVDDGISALTYHGAMTDKIRSATHDRFMSDDSPVVIATNAFGMGVDRGDLNFVVHWDIPGSLEAYYQEVGRAGREGQDAWCELLFNYADIRTQKFFLDGANPTENDVHKLWQTVEESCMAEGEVTCTMNEWAGQACIKNSMTVSSVMAMIERAGLITREVMPGNRCYTVRMHSDSSIDGLEQQIKGLKKKRQRDESKLDKLLQFVYTPGCRHAFVLSYFGEQIEQSGCGGCDRCSEGTNSGGIAPSDEQWLVIQKILSCVARMKGRFGSKRIAAVLHGDLDEAVQRHALNELSTFGLLESWKVKDISAVINVLHSEGCLAQSPDVYRMLSLSDKGRKVMLREVADFKICWPEGAGTKKGARKNVASVDSVPLPIKGLLVSQLREWASKKAGSMGVPIFHVLNRKTIEAIAAATPENFTALEEVKGMGPVKVQRFGREILNIVTQHN
ncbi:MAG: RecQ family ATP-dependent DNA helicase [Kiritimatiellae bacterium]|jgi:ATP-dependent DNA helicase RecQ|nr:RecQ family ATP-dependent DNA helicase [Kiritimatiellia bacterium]